jgi:3-oxoacid CoA-transferase subunit B
MIPGKLVEGMGGAMDLVHGARARLSSSWSTSPATARTIVNECSLPYTGRSVVRRIITDLAVLHVPPDGEGFTLIELAPGVTEAEVSANRAKDQGD